MKIFNRIPEHWIPFLSLLGAVLGWGWAWVGIRGAVQYYGPGELALGRYCVASMVLFPLWIKRGRRLPAGRDILTIIIMGITGFSIYNFFINTGEQTITAGTTSLIGCSLPILTTLGAWLFFKEKLTLSAWIGIMAAFAGVMITALGAHGGLHFSYGALLILLAMISAAVYGLLTKKMVTRYSPLEITTWSIWAGTIALIPLGHGLCMAVTVVPWQATANMILLGILPGAISYALYSFAIAHLRMASVSSFVFLMPVTAIILGWFLLGELPSWLSLIGGAITLGGAYLVNAQKKTKS
ncbi:MAG: DMT family transporter [Chthoniobacterales bacterium]